MLRRRQGPVESMEGKTLFDRLVAQLPPRHQDLLGARIQRTVSLLANSSPGRRHPVMILIYGQSITAGLRQTQIEQALKEEFPNAEISYLERGSRGAASGLCTTKCSNLRLPQRFWP